MAKEKMMPNDVCANYHKGHPASEAAYQETPEKCRGLDRRRVLQLMRERPCWWTCAELEGMFVAQGWKEWPKVHQTISARVSQLKADGLIAEVCGEDGKPLRRGKHTVLQLTEKGRKDG